MTTRKTSKKKTGRATSKTRTAKNTNPEVNDELLDDEIEEEQLEDDDEVIDDEEDIESEVEEEEEEEEDVAPAAPVRKRTSDAVTTASPTKEVMCRGVENHTCTIGGKPWRIEKDKDIKLPSDVATILSNAHKVFKK